MKKAQPPFGYLHIWFERAFSIFSSVTFSMIYYFTDGWIHIEEKWVKSFQLTCLKEEIKRRKKGYKGLFALLITYITIFYFFLFVLFFFSGPHLHNMQVPWLRVKLELQLPTYITTIATWNLSCICSLHQSL